MTKKRIARILLLAIPGVPIILFLYPILATLVALYLFALFVLMPLVHLYMWAFEVDMDDQESLLEFWQDALINPFLELAGWVWK